MRSKQRRSEGVTRCPKGGVCLGLFWFFTKINRSIETKGMLWLWAFPKPTLEIHGASEAPGNVFPAALPLKAEAVHWTALIALPIYKRLPRILPSSASLFHSLTVSMSC
jgi:hypothetical protein